jgi:alpha-galactosidase
MTIERSPDGFTWRGIGLGGIEPFADADPAPGRELSLAVEIRTEGDTLHFAVSLDGAACVRSLGLNFARVEGVRAYLRNGYQSWDGSFFVPPGTRATGDEPRGKSPTVGHAVTALLPSAGEGALVLGFTRHDRFQSRFRFGEQADGFGFAVETLFDSIACDGKTHAEPLILFAEEQVEAALRRWSERVAEQSPLPPRLPERRITGWCSWYSLYAAIDEPVLLEHLAAAAEFRDRWRVPLDIFQIDDGFTPEMGDWLDVKPQFPRGMKPLLADIAAAGFRPGLWIAPFLVGNRSRLYAEHPDWVVQRADGGGPLAHMKFYGEFRWHKRSEEYYILDITHPEAEAYIRRVFRTWRHDWGCLYFKADFLLAGGDYGPDEAVWHRSGLSRIAIWRTMMSAIREEIGEEALLLGSGSPLWASVGLVDAVRIGRDIGVTWHGQYSAESLLRDQLTRNHGSGILWQADPDCVLLRDRFHELTADQLRSLALFAGLAGGVLMTSDKLDFLPEERQRLFAALLAEPKLTAEFPRLGQPDQRVIEQVAVRPDGSRVRNLFNTSGEAVEGLEPYASQVEDEAGKLGEA